MPSDPTLSQEIETYIEQLDFWDDHDLSPQERKEAQKSRSMVEVIVSDIIKSRETLTESKLHGIESLIQSDPDLIGHFLDEFYTREVVRAVRGYVQRTMNLSRLQAARTPSTTTNSYLREAVRTYVFGFPQASIALSRAALEQALKEELGHQDRKVFLEMNSLLDEAEGAGVIDGVIRRTARRIATEADGVLHEKPADLAKAYNVLLMLRGVLQHIYTP